MHSLNIYGAISNSETYVQVTRKKFDVVKKYIPKRHQNSSNITIAPKKREVKPVVEEKEAATISNTSEESSVTSAEQEIQKAPVKKKRVRKTKEKE